jgi:hypothetical protein
VSKKDSNFVPIQEILTVLLGLISDSLAVRLRLFFLPMLLGRGSGN